MILFDDSSWWFMRCREKRKKLTCRMMWRVWAFTYDPKSWITVTYAPGVGWKYKVRVDWFFMGGKVNFGRFLDANDKQIFFINIRNWITLIIGQWSVHARFRPGIWAGCAISIFLLHIILLLLCELTILCCYYCANRCWYYFIKCVHTFNFGKVYLEKKFI